MFADHVCNRKGLPHCYLICDCQSLLGALESCGKPGNPCTSLNSLRFPVPRSRDNGRAFRLGAWTITSRKSETEMLDVLLFPYASPGAGKCREVCESMHSLAFLVVPDPGSRDNCRAFRIHGSWATISRKVK